MSTYYVGEAVGINMKKMAGRFPNILQMKYVDVYIENTNS